MNPFDVSTPVTRAVAANARHLAVLDNVHAVLVRAAREAPRHRVMARHARAALDRGAQHRVSAVQVDGRLDFLDLLGREEFGVHAVQAVRIHSTLGIAHVLQRMREIHHAALAEHHVVVEVLREPFPELHRFLIERGRLVPQIVRTHDGRVARRIAAADPAFLQNRDVLHAVLLREVIGRCETMPAAADDHHVVLLLRLRASPLPLPVLVIRQPVAEQTEYRIAAHLADPLLRVTISFS